MASIRLLSLAALALAALSTVGASAQSMNAGQCILAGRITAEERWAPRFDGVQLLAPKGRIVSAATRQALADVERVRLAKPALLSQCDGDGELARADGEAAIPKEPVPAVPAGELQVESVSFPKLRTGGALVELKLRFPVERVVMVKR